MVRADVVQHNCRDEAENGILLYLNIARTFDPQ
jgi:hypothetical protein